MQIPRMETSFLLFSHFKHGYINSYLSKKEWGRQS